MAGQVTLRSTPVNRLDEKDRYLELLGEEILILRDSLAVLEAKYARVQAWTGDDGFDVDERPRVDGRVFPSAGSDVVGEWRPEPEGKSA